MIYTELTCKAMKIAYDAHHGQLDKNGVPYIFHPFHLAEQMTDEFAVCAALLHDVAEDTDITIADLEKVFPHEVTDAVKLLTHDKKDDYFDYVRKISTDNIAKAVKTADLMHNSDMSRYIDDNMKNDPENLKRVEKYKKALKLLRDNS